MRKTTIHIESNADSNYSFSGDMPFEIQKAVPELSISTVEDKTIEDTSFALQVANPNGGTPTYESSNPNVLTVDVDGTVTLVGPGTATVKVSIPASANYKAGTATVDITVKKKAAALTVTNISYDLVYGASDFTIGYNKEKGESDVLFRSSNENVATVDNTGKVSIVGAGTAIITLAMAESDHYEALNKEVTVNVDPKDITVTADDKTKVYGDLDEKHTYHVNDGGLVGSDTLSNILFHRASGENVGDYDITPSQSAGANNNYNITFIAGTYSITQKDIANAEVTLGEKLYYTGVEQTQTIKTVIVDGLYVAYEITGDKATDVGSYTMTLTGKDNFTGTKTQSFVILNKQNPTEAGSVTVDAKVNPDTPKLEFGTNKTDLIDILLTANDVSEIVNGKTFDIWLETKDETNNVSPVTKKLIMDGISDYKLGIIMDIKLFKKLSGTADATILTDLDHAIKLAVTVPDTLISKDTNVERTYAIARNHNGKVDILDASFDAKTKILTFETDRFSDYAIIYKDKTTGSGSGTTTQQPAQQQTSAAIVGASLPKTGDDFNVIAWILLMMASLAGMTGVVLYKKKQKRV